MISLQAPGVAPPACGIIKCVASSIQNKKARHDYFVLETVEAGIVLKGTEVKAAREGRVSLGESFARVKDGEVFLFNTDIAEYSHAGKMQHAPKRTRKLLLRKGEIAKLQGKVSEKGMTLVPLSMYFKRGFAKVQLALVKSKREYDKREVLKKREASREIRRVERRSS